MTTQTILLIFLAIGLALGFAYFQYFYKSKQDRKGSWVYAILRFLSVLALLFLLINPQIKSTTLSNIKPSLNVLVDNSSSIEFTNNTEELNANLNLIRDSKLLNEKYDIHYFSFADDLSTLDSLRFNISETNLTKALGKVDELQEESSQAATVLITDGNQTHGRDYLYHTAKHPIYPIVIGDTLRHEDIRIRQVNANSYASLNNQFPVELFMQYDGTSSITKRLSIYTNGKVVYSKQLNFSEINTTQQLQLYLPANKVGVRHYRAQIEYLDQEHNTVNNSESFSVEVIDEQAKIVIVSDLKHPDVGMLKRSIEANKLVEASIEGNLSKVIDLDKYQLIICYQPNVKFKGLFENIKAAKSNVFIITGTQTDWNFLNEAQDFFSKQNRAGTENFGANYNPDFDEFVMNDIGFGEFAPLSGIFGDLEFKTPNKTIIFQNIENFATENPLIGTFTKDNQRGAFLFGEGIWKWRMLSKIEQTNTSEFDGFIHKIIQYLTSSKRARRLELAYERSNYSNRDVRINAQYYDANYVFDPEAILKLSYKKRTASQGQEIPFALKNNRYDVILSDLSPGVYDFNVKVDKQNIQKSGSFTVLDYDVEQQLSSANINDLRKLALASGGNVFVLNETNRLIDTLIDDKSYATVQKSSSLLKSLIEIKWLLGLIVFLLAAEWFIRKYRGLI